MKLYELTYLMPFDLPEKETKTLHERISSYVIENQGTFDKVDDLVKKRLGEPIKNQTMALMLSMRFYMNQEKIGDLEKKVKNEKQILHHMILNKKPKKAIEAHKRIRQTLSDNIEGESKTIEKPKKVEIKEIEKKLEEILGE
jgi:ribosomal protein S6